MVRLDASLATLLKEVAQAFVPERFDDDVLCCVVLCCVALRNVTLHEQCRRLVKGFVPL